MLVTQVNALLPLQAPSGAWRTLLDDPSSYEEISATAGFGYGLLKGYRLGLGTPAWRAAGLRALEAVLSNIDEAGTVLNVSYGTRMGHDLQFYRDIPIQPTGYGQALAILCLSEALHHVERRGGGGMTMRVLYGAGPEDIAGYDTERLRDAFLIGDLFAPDAVRFVYTHVDRLILGGAVPVRRDARLRRRRGDRHAAPPLGARDGHRQPRRPGHASRSTASASPSPTATCSTSVAARGRSP